MSAVRAAMRDGVIGLVVVMAGGSLFLAEDRRLRVQIDDWHAQIEKQHGKGSVMRLGDQTHAQIEVILREGRNRQVRRMTAAVGLPTLRLVRVAVGPHRLDGLQSGQWRHTGGP